MLTLEEQECRAYIAGNVELAAALGAAIDVESERVEELEHEVSMRDDEIASLRAQLDDLELELHLANA